MVPRTDLGAMRTHGHALLLSRSAQSPALKSASEGSSLRSKAKTDAVLMVVVFVAMMFTP